MATTSRLPFASAAVVTLLALAAFYVVRFLWQGYKIRSMIHKLPGPPHSWLWGHLQIMGEVMKTAPLKAHPHVLALRIKKDYNIQSDFFYMDIWPIAEPILYILDPNIAQQLTVDYVAPKHSSLRDFLVHLAGPGDIISTSGPEWKRLRAMFNPGFASQHLMTLASGIVDDCLVFRQKMARFAETGEVIRLEDHATRLTVDIIGKVSMDLQLNTQLDNNEMVTAFRDQVTRLPTTGLAPPWFYYLPYGAYKRWRNDQIMNRYIGKVLDERFAMDSNTAVGSEASAAAAKGPKNSRKRAIIDLAMEAYQKEQAEGKAPGRRGTYADFKSNAIVQIRAFIFAGHDTTSTAIAYAMYLLHKHPEVLKRLREEHDAVLGPMETTAQTIKDNPYIVYKLEYTLAVIKESLRLFPPVSGTRGGEPGLTIRDPKTGEAFPAPPGFLLWIVHYAQHRNPNVWRDPEVFDPTRFLPENEGNLIEGAWRPFEKGPRNCIGQELALIESRIILALVCRSFDMEPAFEAVDSLKDDTVFARDPGFRVGKQDVDGEPAYPVLLGTAKPREGMPCRVKKVPS